MTHIIIHTNKTIRAKYLLKLITFLLKKDISKMTALENMPDIHILRAQGNSIGIEAVKNLQKEMIFKPFEEKYQIGIIDDAFNLTEEAQNALLKTLEEQSASTIYILMLDNEQNVLTTILSRGIKHFVKEKGEEVPDILKPEILKKDLIDEFKEIEEISKGTAREVLDYLSQLEGYFRQGFREKIKEGRKIKSSYEILKNIQTAKERIRGNGNKKLVLENLMLQINDI